MVPSPSAAQFWKTAGKVRGGNRSAGAGTLEAMSSALNQRGICSARGGRWSAYSVAKLLVRAARVLGQAA